MKKSLKMILALTALLTIVLAGGGYYYYANLKSTDNIVLPTIKVAYNPQNLDPAILIIAYEKGYFKDQGINVELVQATGSEATVAISSGKVDLAAISAPRIYTAIENGANIKMLSPFDDTDSQLFVRPDSGITSLKELEGKTVSYGTGGGVKELYLKSVLKNEGVDVSKITFVDVDNAYLAVALMDKKTVDAVMISDAHYVDIATGMGALILPEWATKNYAKTTTGMAITANMEYLNTNSANVESFFKAMIEANRYLKNDTDAAAVIVTDFLREATNNAMDTKASDFSKLVNEGKITYVLWEDTTDVVQMAELSYEVGNVKTVLSESDLYDLRFKSMLENAQNEIYGTQTN